MSKFTGTITFLYYKNFEYGKQFIETVFEVQEVMNQGWAMVYQISEKSFIGIVKKEEDVNAGDTLLSFNTKDLEGEYSRIKELSTHKLTDIQVFDSIPLKSFFFQDKEGHRFEIQEFINEEDKKRF